MTTSTTTHFPSHATNALTTFVSTPSTTTTITMTSTSPRPSATPAFLQHTPLFSSLRSSSSLSPFSALGNTNNNNSNCNNDNVINNMLHPKPTRTSAKRPHVRPAVPTQMAVTPHTSRKSLTTTTSISTPASSTRATATTSTSSSKSTRTVTVTATATNSKRVSRTSKTSKTSVPASNSVYALKEWRGEAPARQVQVLIDRPAPNRRIISAVNLINAPVSVVWNLLSDYDRLADHIPNLVESRLRPHPSGGIRLEQCGSQSILGFKFRAALVMDIFEEYEQENNNTNDMKAIHFDLVSSSDFREFKGFWKMIALNPTKTCLYYSLAIVPKGLVPVAAIEWRISEDVPQNMDAIRVECERRRRVATSASVTLRGGS